MTLNQIFEGKWSGENVENTKDFTSDNVELLPLWSLTLSDNVDRTFYNSYGTLLTTMLKQCLDFLWMKIPLSLQTVFSNVYLASSKL